MDANADRLIEIFNEAKARPAGAERERFLAEACHGDHELKEQVLSLLQAHQGAGDFLKNTLLSPTALITEKPGDKIGHYKLLQQIGEGGCGIVYMAEQAEPVRRRVALKVIKLGMDTKQVVARFEAERQALALMDHPNIAKVFDAGATDTGRPFFVMELVRGIKITDYCDQNNLSTIERLDLFIQVCQAVQHAHQKGIIHRDLKPSNILITQHDSVAVPKVIDFGIAKATTDQRLTDKTLFTAFEQFIGTPAYMSPEQAQMSGLDIDTRTDIYSLGVLLYELLTGKTPFDAKELVDAGLDEMRRTIREKEPVRPSTRLTQELSAVAASRESAADFSDEDGGALTRRRYNRTKELINLLRGDLDWIVMRCLEKDRTRRYETANGLAMDLHRHLNNEPVIARPPSAAYRFQKFARRNKAALLTATVIISALLLTIAALSLSTLRIAQEQRTTKKALRAETHAKGELEQTLDRERRDSYFHRITLAQRELSVDNLAATLRFLNECPEDLRGWEWYYLMRLCRIEPVVIRDAAEVHSIAFPRTGDRIAAACGDGTVKIFDTRTRQVIQTLRGHGAYVFSVAFSPDGQHVASMSADRTLRLWAVATGKEIFQRPGHVGDYTGMTQSTAFSPDGQLLMAGGDDGIATIWDATDGREVHRLPEQHEYTPLSAAFSPDGRLLAIGSWAGVLRIWDPRTGQLLKKINAHTHRLSAIVFHPQGRWLATAGFDRTLKIWNLGTGELLQTLRGHHGVISGLACSRDGQRLFSGGTEDKMIKVWDPETGREVLNLRGHTVACHGLAFSPDGLRLVSAGGDGTIRIWDAERLHGNEHQESLTCEHDNEVWSVEYSPDGQQIATGTFGGALRLWDARTGAQLRTLTSGDVRNVFRTAFSPDGTRLAASTVTEDRVATIKMWATATGAEVSSIREKSAAFFVTFDPSGRFLVREGPEYTVQVREAESGKLVGVVGRHERQIWGMAFSPDGQLLATASNDGTVRVWKWNPRRLGQPQEPLKLPVRIGGYTDRVAFSADSQCLATGGEGQTARIWDAKTGEELHTLRAHTGDVFSLAFSGDGQWLATAGEDTTIRIWNAKSWELRCTLRGHTGVVNTLAFSPDSRHLASGSRDHTMKVWDTARWDAGPER